MKQKITYWVDEYDIICKVDDNWDSSLKETENRVKSHQIIGKSLFDFICDDSTRMYLRTLLQSVRLIPRLISRPYRCDSPTERRFMQMDIELQPDKIVCISHQLLRTEPIIRPVIFQTLDKTKIIGKNYHVRCSLCNRIKLMDSKIWHEIDEIDLITPSLQVVYGLCDDCLVQLEIKKNQRRIK